MSDSRDSKRCPECRSTNIYLEGTREHRAKQVPPAAAEAPVVAKTLSIRCRRCNASWAILRKVTG